MPSLHVLNKSPDHPRFETCLNALADDDILVLVENAVLGLGSTSELKSKVFALKSDVLARGLPENNPEPEIELIDMSGWVALTVTYSHIIHW